MGWSLFYIVSRRNWKDIRGILNKKLFTLYNTKLVLYSVKGDLTEKSNSVFNPIYNEWYIILLY